MAYNHEWPYTDPNRANTDWEINTVKALQKKVEEFDDVIQRLIEALKELDDIEARLAALEVLKQEVDALILDVATLNINYRDLAAKVVALERDFASIVTLIDSKVAVEAAKRREEDEKILAIIHELSVELNTRIDDLEAAIEKLLPVDVYNRIAGRRMGLDENNYHLYEDLRYGGFTNAQLATYGISNEDVAARSHDNRDFALNAKQRFNRYYVYAPDGNRKALTNALSDIIVVIKGGATNDAFNAYMVAEALTNENLGDVISTNFARFSALTN